MKNKSILKMVLVAAVLLTGCKSAAPSDTGAKVQTSVFEGAHVQFQYEEGQWNMTQSENSLAKVVTASNSQGNVSLSLVYFEGETTPDQVYDKLYGRETKGGTVSQVTTTNLYENGVGDAQYRFHVSVTEDNQYDMRLKMVGLESGGQIAALARVKTSESFDPSGLDQLWDSITYSEKAETEGLAATPSADRLTAEQLREYTGLLEKKKAESTAVGMVEADGYEYLKYVKLESKKGFREILAPLEREDDIRKSGLYYFEHGIQFEASLESITTGDTTQILRSMMRDKKDYYDENASEYEGYEEGEILIQNGIGFSWSKVNQIAYDGSIEPAVSVFYVEDEIPENEEKRLVWDLTLESGYADETAYKIAEELEQAYQVELVSLLPPMAERTIAGDMVRPGIENYVDPIEASQRVLPMEGYELMGEVKISASESEENERMVTVYVPRGNRTGIFGSGEKIYKAYGDMYGVGLDVDFENVFGRGSDPKETVKSQLEIVNQTMGSRTRDYKNLTIEDVIVNEDNTMAMGIARCQMVHTLGNEYPYVRIFVVEKQEGGEILSLDLVLNTSEYVRRTDVLLKEIESLYGLDLSEYYYDAVSPEV